MDSVNMVRYLTPAGLWVPIVAADSLLADDGAGDAIWPVDVSEQVNSNNSR